MYTVIFYLIVGIAYYRIDLVEVEFLHPASLDFIGSLPNLKELSVINPSVIGNWNIEIQDIQSASIGDDMFLELPDLCPNPFPSLVKIDYEGQISKQMISYLTKFSPNLKEITLKCEEEVLEPKCLENLYLNQKQYLQKLIVHLTVATKGEIFITELIKIINCSDSLELLGR